MKTIDGYEHLQHWVIPCYRYIEGDPDEEMWIDTQNCYYYTFEDADDNDLIDGKKYWIIEPFKPKGMTITEENKDQVRWFVAFCSDTEDHDKEWDFETHKPKPDDV
jgi:hypothetical protein